MNIKKLTKSLYSIWKNKILIFQGLWNKLYGDPLVEAIAEARSSICSKCDYIDLIGSDCMVPGTQPCCKECGCSLSIKTRALDSECPKGYWNPVQTK